MLIDIVSILHLPHFMYKGKSLVSCRMDVVFAITQEIIRRNHLDASYRDCGNRVGCCAEGEEMCWLRRMHGDHGVASFYCFMN